VDVQRGLALFGVLVANLVRQFRVSSFDAFLPSGFEPSTADALVDRVLTLSVDTKPLVLFSFLFGMGLAAQHEEARRRQRAFAPQTARRLSFLFAVGVGHFVLLWSGDVLALYAIVAIVAALLLALPTRALVVVACALLLVHVLPLPYPRPFASFDAMRMHVEEARRVYARGSYAEVVAFRMHEAAPALALLLWSVPRTLGLFLLGACAWRVRLVAPAPTPARGSSSSPRDPRSRARLVKTTILTTAIGAAAATLTRAGGLHGTWLAVAVDASDISFALAFGAAVVLAVELPGVGAPLRGLAPIGRMTLTSYLVESLVLGFVFYGYGLGLFGRVGHAAGVAIAIALFVAQAVFAAAWLRRHRLGPIEGVWRAFARARA
jgi:uncharacterized protein